MNAILASDVAKSNGRPRGASTALAALAGLAVVVLPLSVFAAFTVGLTRASGDGNPPPALYVLAGILALAAGILAPYGLMRVALAKAGRGSGAGGWSTLLVVLTWCAFGAEFVAGGALLLMLLDQVLLGPGIYLFLAVIAVAGTALITLSITTKRQARRSEQWQPPGGIYPTGD